MTRVIIKECIIHNDKTYCESKYLPMQETGIVIMLVLAALAYTVLALHLSVEFEKLWILVLMLLGPIFLLGLLLIFCGS